MKLNQIADNPGSRKNRMRIGRGIGSGMGKTGGRGGKGQTARSGVRIKGFEGGQMPLHRRLPKRGFNNIFAKKFNELNLGKIQGAIDAGTLDGTKTITVEALKEAGLIRRVRDGVRLLGGGEIKGALVLEVTGASASAVKAVEAKGGTVTVKSITGREKPAADFIKAEKRAKKREALAARAAAKGGKPKAAEDEGEAESPKAKKAKPEGKAGHGEAKPAKKDKSE